MENADKLHAAQFALRLPTSLKNAAKRIANESGVSLNRFISLAVAEKIEHHAKRTRESEE
jgi:predicted HicB family RNase H-like nuclease